MSNIEAKGVVPTKDKAKKPPIPLVDVRGVLDPLRWVFGIGVAMLMTGLLWTMADRLRAISEVEVATRAMVALRLAGELIQIPVTPLLVGIGLGLVSLVLPMRDAD